MIQSYQGVSVVTSPNPESLKAGKIAARVLHEISQMVKPKERIIKICSTAEKKTREYGGIPAFPCNVSVNHIAAHSTSPRGDKSEIPEFGLVKLDVGVHVDGYIADTALTVDIDGTLDGFIAATEDALTEAISTIQPGKALGEVGATIERVIKAYGLKPISNLTGHDLKRYRLHAGKQVPNIKTRGTPTFEIGEYYAIEPFATSGIGTVIDSDYIFIFGNTGIDVPLEGTAEKLRKYLRDTYGPLPFASRWIGTSAKDIDVINELKQLIRERAIRGFPMQIEKKGRPVSQTEHTIFISDDGPMILTIRN
ncbi:type II methionyl aminopeptidase [Candidatus Thorarchaeota archaeon]|nr:MAG: type II methionyl aminopeptidase [Candidatus Thorarchaeota archaeon]